jgi:hypothetical protein
MFFSTSSMHFSIKAGIVSLLSLASLFSAGSSSAAVLNGSFETGDFSGWQTFGQTSIETVEFGTSPTEGTQQALLDTFCPGSEESCQDNAAGLAAFLGLEMTDLDEIGQGEVFEGSAIKTTLTVESGDTLTFDWNFFTEFKEAEEEYNDFAFVTLSATVLADTYSTFPDSLIDLTKFRYQTGYQTFSYTFTTAGTYTLGIGVAELGDGLDEAGLLVDDVVIASTPPATDVPEPTSVLGVLALGVLGFASRRWQQHSKDERSH